MAEEQPQCCEDFVWCRYVHGKGCTRHDKVSFTTPNHPSSPSPIPSSSQSSSSPSSSSLPNAHVNGPTDQIYGTLRGVRPTTVVTFSPPAGRCLERTNVAMESRWRIALYNPLSLCGLPRPQHVAECRADVVPCLGTRLARFYMMYHDLVDE